MQKPCKNARKHTRKNLARFCNASICSGNFRQIMTRQLQGDDTMKTLFALALLLLLSSPHGSMTGQTYPEGLVMTCQTDDGIVVITEQNISIADYQLRIVDIPADGIATYVDPASNATARLDARSDEGLYIEINEGGNRMLVVADRNAISYTFDRSASAPASPTLSSGLLRDMLNRAEARK
jgi:hypothetical protein